MRALGALAVKILALYFLLFGLFNSINLIVAFLLNYESVSANLSFFETAVFPISYILCGIIFWMFSDSIASFIVKKITFISTDPPIDLNVKLILSTAIAIVGIIAIISAFPKVISTAYILLSFKDLPEIQLIREKTSIIENIIKLLMGFLLILKFKGLTRLLLRLQEL